MQARAATAQLETDVGPRHHQGPKDTRAPARTRRERLALWTFVAAELAIVPYFAWIGRTNWFSEDEWDFLAARTAGNVHDIFLPFNQHWSTLPILAFRLLWEIFGLTTYRPYLLLVLLLHLAIAGLLRLVMRRAGASSWTSTVAALAFALFGAGYYDILYAFQIGFNGSLVFGLVYLLLADHDGALDGRDALGLLCGIASLMSSGVGVAMAIVVATAVLIRRGWRLAAAHAVPLGVIFVVWVSWIGSSAYTKRHTATVGETLRFTFTDTKAVFVQLGHEPGIGVVLGIIVIGGLYLAWHPLDRQELVRRAAAPFALLVGGVVFLAITGVGRGTRFSLAFQQAEASRYLHVAAAMFVPAIGVGASAIAARWRTLAPVVLAAMLVGIPGNVNTLIGQTRSAARGHQIVRAYALTLAHLPIATAIPSLQPETFLLPHVTMGWLAAGAASGRIPSPGPLSFSVETRWNMNLVLPSSTVQKAAECRESALPAVVALRTGDTMLPNTPARVVVSLSPASKKGRPFTFDGPIGPGAYRSTVAMVIDVTPASGDGVIRVCRGAP